MKKAIIFLGVGLIAGTNSAFLKDPTTAVATSSSTTTANANAFKGATATANAAGGASSTAVATDGSKAVSTATNNVDAGSVAAGNGATAVSNATGAADSKAVATDGSVAVSSAKNDVDASSVALGNNSIAVSNAAGVTTSQAVADNGSVAISKAQDNTIASATALNGGFSSANAQSEVDASAVAIDNSFADANAFDSTQAIGTSYTQNVDNCDDVKQSLDIPFNVAPNVSQAINGCDYVNDIPKVDSCNTGITYPSTPIVDDCNTNIAYPSNPINIPNTPISTTPIYSNNNDCGCETAPVVTTTNTGVDVQKKTRYDQDTALVLGNNADAHNAAVQQAQQECFSNKAIGLTNFDAQNASQGSWAGKDSNEVNISRKHADSKVYADKNNNLCHAKRVFAEKCDRSSKEKLDDVHDCYNHSNKNKVCSSECSKDLESSSTDSCGKVTSKLCTWKQKKQEAIHCDSDKGHDDEVHAFKDCQNDYKQYQNVEVSKVHDDDLVKQGNCRQNDYYNNDQNKQVSGSVAQSGSVDYTNLNSLSNAGSLASSFGASGSNNNSGSILGYNNQISAGNDNCVSAYNNQNTGGIC